MPRIVDSTGDFAFCEEFALRTAVGKRKGWGLLFAFLEMW